MWNQQPPGIFPEYPVTPGRLAFPIPAFPGIPSTPGTPSTPGPSTGKKHAWDWTPADPRPKKKVKSSRCASALDVSRWGKSVKTYEDIPAAHVVFLFRLVLPLLWNDPRQRDLLDVEPTMAAAFQRYMDSPLEPLGCENPAAWFQTMSMQYQSLGQPLQGKTAMEVRRAGEALMAQHRQERLAQQQAQYEAMQQEVRQNQAMMQSQFMPPLMGQISAAQQAPLQRQLFGDQTQDNSQALNLSPGLSMWSHGMMQQQQQQALESMRAASPWWQASAFPAGSLPAALWQHPHQEAGATPAPVPPGLAGRVASHSLEIPGLPERPVPPVHTPGTLAAAVPENSALNAAVGDGSGHPAALISGLPGCWFSSDDDGHLYVGLGDRTRRLHRRSSGGADDYKVTDEGTLSSVMLGLSISLFDLLVDTDAEPWPAP